MIKDSILEEIKQYCKDNSIDDINSLVNKMLSRGFSIEKFGETPSKPSKPPKVIEVEVEKIVEKPVEVIKEVEVEVEKIVKVSDDEKIEGILKEMNQKEEDYKKIIDTFKTNRMEQTQQIMKLNKEKDLIREEFETKIKELEEKLNKVKNQDKKDIYGEGDEDRPKGLNK